MMVKLRVKAASASNSCSFSAFSASMKDSVMSMTMLDEGDPVGAFKDDVIVNQNDALNESDF